MRLWRGTASVVAVGACALAVGCGGGGSSKGPVTLNWWSGTQPGGSFQKAAERCTKEAKGRYRIVFNAMANNPEAQRQQLVRRLAARDSSIDLLSMDVIWTAEFAEAEWVLPWPRDLQKKVSRGTLEGPLKTAMYKGRMYGAPGNSNTQLLWYRKDLVKSVPKTWDEMIDQATKLKTGGRIEVTGGQYEGTTVWFNSLIQSAGGTILDGPNRVGLQNGPTQRALEVMEKLGTSSAADPSINLQRENELRLAFEGGDAAYQVNYPFVYASAKAENPKLFKQLGWALYPRVDADKTARPAVGGYNWGVGSATKNREEAFDAAVCLRSKANQRGFSLIDGLPPTTESIYDEPKFRRAYPFGDLIRKSLADGAVRPASPVYSDVSRAVFMTVSPIAEIGNVDRMAQTLRDRVKDALASRGLI